MAKKKKVEVKKPDPKESGVYKGYDVRWLKREPDHPDYGLVAEYEKKFGEI